ncbi:MAG: TonB-dependent receptor [Pseudomonadota bacterium]|nr:TonB-dependent receptor [Pseudomonadota bacterium]
MLFAHLMFATILGSGGTLAMAQERAPAALDRVEITGSRLPQAANQPASPVQVIRRDDIDRAGAQTVEDVLSLSSSFFGRNTDAGNVGFTGNPGQSLVGLRSYPGTNVLVLLNGRRLIAYAFGDAGVDLSSIPVAALDRVEILKDGASAIYGSDAHAGVINFITKKDFRGAVLDLYGGTTEAGGATSTRTTLTLGAGELSTDRYNVFVVLDRQQTTALVGRHRLFASTGYRPQDGLDSTSVASFPANIPIGGGRIANPAAPACTPRTVFKNGGCYFDGAAFIDLIPPSENLSLLSRGALHLSESQEAYAEILLARHRTDDEIPPTPVRATTTIDGSPLVLPASSPFYPQGLGLSGDLVDLRYRPLPLGPRVRRTIGDHGRLLLGLRGVADGWDYDTAVGYVTSRGKQSYRSGYLDSAKIVAAFATGLINPFGESGPEGNALLADSVLRGEVRRARGSAESVDFRASRALMQWPAGAVNLALGGEARHETLADAPSDLAGLAVGAGRSFGVGAPSGGSRTSHALYGELGLPLASGLEAQLALRADRYNGGVGSTLNPKASLRWQPLPALVLRASAGTGFLAPSLPELYTSRTAEFGTFGPDPVRCPRTRAPSDCNVEATLISGGNPDLKPSRSTQTNVGLVLEPVRGTTFAIDYWRMRVKDILLGGDVSFVLSGDPQFEGRNIVRGPVDPATPGLPGPITQILIVTENSGRHEISGLDIDLRARSDIGPWGRFNAGLNGTYVLDFSFLSFPGTPPAFVIGASSSGFSIARWQHHATLGWELGGWAATIGQTYRRGYIDEQPDGNGQPRRVGSYILWDAQLAYRELQTPLGAAKLAIGAKNVFDRTPPFSNQQSYGQSGYDPFYADPRGRFWYATLSLRLR